MSRKSRTHNFRSDKKLKVLVDMDQVLCDFESGFLTKYKERFPEEPHIRLEDRNTFYICDQYKKLRRDLQDKAREVLHAEGFFLSLQPIEGACSAVQEMSQMEDVDVFICTSPLTFYKHCIYEKFKWVEDHLGPEWINRVILCKDKTMVDGDVLIDDRPRIHGVQDPPPWRQVLFSTPYNLCSDLRGRQRLDSWTDGQWRDIIADFSKRL